MKKASILVAMLLFCGYSGFAQINKGNILLSGGVSISNNSLKVPHSNSANSQPSKTNIIALPQVSYLVSNNLAVGVEFGYHAQNKGSVQTNGTTRTSFSDETRFYAAGAFVRYYVPVVNRLYFYTQAGVSAFDGDIDNYTTEIPATSRVGTQTVIETDFWGMNFGLRPGLQYFIGNRIALDASVALVGLTTLQTTDEASKIRTNRSSFNYTPNAVTLGLTYRFGRSVNQ